jgi:hypothetical protein
VETAGVEPAPPRCKRGAHPHGPHPQVVRRKGAADRIRTGTARITTSNAGLYTTATSNGDDRTRTGGLSPDKRVLSPLSYVPKEWRGWDSNPRSRAHEAREDSRSSTALRARTRSGRLESNQRSPVPETGGVAVPHSQTKNPRRDSNPRFRAENPASLPLDHGACRCGRQDSNLRRVAFQATALPL